MATLTPSLVSNTLGHHYTLGNHGKKVQTRCCHEKHDASLKLLLPDAKHTFVSLTDRLMGLKQENQTKKLFSDIIRLPLC